MRGSRGGEEKDEKEGGDWKGKWKRKAHLYCMTKYFLLRQRETLLSRTSPLFTYLLISFFLLFKKYFFLMI